MNDKRVKNRWLHVRMDEQEFSQLRAQFAMTTERKLSAYARKILLGQPMIKGQRNLSAEAFLVEFSFLLKTLNGIGNNFNQAVHKLHMADKSSDVQRWAAQYSSQQQLLLKDIAAIKSIIQKVSLEWLQS